MAEPPDPLVAVHRGLAVFPLPPGGRRPAPGWHQQCFTDPVLVRQRWRPGDNIGVGCRASALVGIDLDRHPGGPDGIAAFVDLCARHGGWPETLTVRTPHGGLHLYYRVPTGQTIGSGSGTLAAGIDVRGPGCRSGGYLIGPDSVVEGVRYVIERDRPLEVLPAWLGGLLAA